MNGKRIRLWDLPTRIAHWSLAILVISAVASGKMGGNAMDWHGRIGQSILGLLVFRIVWGFAGSTYARFAHFFPTPAAAIAYLRGQWRGVGHNPLGAFSVFSLLAVLVLQVGTGLFGNDDIAFQGPLFDLIRKDLSDRLTGIHKLSTNLLIALVVLHIAAIAFYIRIRKENLLEPMLTGWKKVTHGEAESSEGGGMLAFIGALLVALAVVYAASGLWLPAAPPPPPAASPAW